MLAVHKKILLMPLFLGLLASCAQYDSQRGVDVVWQADAVAKLESGKTTRAEVLERFGPPSQVISLGDESVLYYLFEHSKGEGLILVVYNRMQVNTQYDRAIFFFDVNGVLTDFASHIKPQDDA